MQKPRIQRTIEPIFAPDGDLYLLRPGAAEDIRIAELGETERQFLAALDGTRSIPELEARFGSDQVAEVVEQLQAVSVLEDAADDELIPTEDRERFDRQHRYFSATSSPDLPPSECQRRLREATVAVIGVGGLGGAVARALASIGVGTLRLVDGDVVEMSNLNRQTLYTEADLGRSKAEAAARALRAFNSGVSIETEHKRLESEAEVADFIAGADFVVDAADWPAHQIERWCNAACFAAGTPCIAMAQYPPKVRIGPLYVPGQTGCYLCQEESYRRQFPLFDVAAEQRARISSPAATLGPACEIVGGMIGMEILSLLTGINEPTTLGAAMVYDLHTMETEREPVPVEPDCPICRHPANSRESSP